MNFTSLLGKKLKDDDVVEVLEAFDMNVVYDFDRVYEGRPDVYWAESKPSGFQLRFNDAQTLDAIFLYVAPRDGFAPISVVDLDVPLFRSTTDAEAFGTAQRLSVRTGTADFLGIVRHWVRLDWPTNSMHYEFHDGVPALITLSLNTPHPAV